MCSRADELLERQDLTDVGPGGPELIHWSIPDPAREPGSDEETPPAFERTATELCTRVGFLIEAIEQTTHHHHRSGGDRTCLTNS